MKRIQSKAGLLKKRVRAVQGRAKFVGMIYLLMTVALAAVVAVLTLVQGTCLSASGKMPVIAFYEEVAGLFNAGFGSIFADPALIIKFLILVLYLILLLVVVINVLRALSKLNWLFKKRASYVNGFNRNMYAMDAISKRFSSSFAALIIINLLIVLLSMVETDAIPAVTMMGYIVLGACGVIHFIFRMTEGTVMLFTTGSKIIEEKRDHGVFVYFIRNLVQIAAVAGILFFFVPVCGFGQGLYDILTEILVNGNMMYVVNLGAIPVYVELFLLFCLMVLIKHATAATEYNRDCNHGSGMKNFAIFAFFSALLLGALILLPYLGIGLAEGEAAVLNMSILWATIIAFVAFLFDCICKPRDKKRVEAENDEDPVPADEEAEETPVLPVEETAQVPYGLPIQPQFQMYQLPPYYQAPQAAQQPAQMPYQPIILPIYCPAPQAQQTELPVMMAEPYAPPAPAPAPIYLLPSPSPAVAAQEAKEEKQVEEAKELKEVEETVEIETLNPYRRYKVRCPQCGKELMVRDTSPYHRCPACDKVFKLRKFKTYVKRV